MKNTIIKVLSVVMAMVMLMGSVLVVSASAADECKHENYEQYGDPVPATCTEWGFTLYQCSDCKKHYKSEFNTLEAPHNLTKDFEWVVKEEVAGTCLADAYKITACPICDKENVVVTANSKGDHDWSEWTTVNATCTADGNKTRTCATCAKVETQALSFKGHEWVADKANYVEPKCTSYLAAYGYTDAKLAEGSMPYTCKNCDATRTIVIEPVDYHTYVAMDAEADTCEVIGHNKGNFCKWCKAGQTAADVVTDVLKHNWVIDWTKEYKAATCEEAGFQTMKCTNCSETFVETVKAAGHDFDEKNPTTYVEATCTTWGYKLFGCTKCGNKFTNVSIEPLGHKWSETGVAAAPTCTKPGRVEYACTNTWHKDGVEVFCIVTNDVEDKNAPAYGHKWDDGKSATEDRAAVAATCTTAGTAAGKWCNRCNAWAEGGAEIKPLGHALVTNVCTAKGLMDIVCSRTGCDYVDKTAEPVTITGGKESHALIVISVVDAECTKPGYEYRVCKYCDKYNSDPLKQTIPAKGHTTKESKQDATCVAAGWEIVTCEVCFAQISDKVLPVDPNGHTFAEGSEAKAPTCDKKGYEHGMCLNCGFVTEKELPALGHDIVNIPAKAATCLEKGNEAGYYCKRDGCAYAKEAKEIAALGHDDKTDKSVIKGYAPTCTAKGLSDGAKCLRCETITTKQTELAAYDHVYNGVQYSETVTTTKTCKDAGSIGFVAHECYYCDEAVIDGFEYIPAHKYPTTWTKKEASCESEGYEFRLCENCGLEQKKEGSTVKATGHKNKAGTVFAAACSYAEGFDTKCTNKNCEYANVAYIVPVVHNYVTNEVFPDTCEGTTYKLSVCDDCGHQVVTGVGYITVNHKWEVVSGPAAGEKAKVDKALTTVSKCKDCGKTKTEYTTVAGPAMKTEIKNLTDGGDFVEGTKTVQVVIYLRGDKVAIHNFQAKFTYDKAALTYKSAKIASSIGDGKLNGAVHNPDAGVINLTAYANNDAEGNVVDVRLSGEWEAFITIEFSVNAEIFKGKSASDFTNGKISYSMGLAPSNAADSALAEEYRYFYNSKGQAVKCGISGAQNKSIDVYKLGDVNKDGIVNSADFLALQQCILAEAYLAQADLDGDGAVKAKDLSLLQKLVVGSYTTKQLAEGR